MAEDFGLPLLEAARRAGTTVAEERQPKDRFVQVNGLKLHYLDWGGRNEPVVLCLHGFAQNAHTWDFAALALCQRYHMLALDQRGHGDSAWAPDGDYSQEAQVRDAEEFVRVLGLQRFLLMGLSMGGRNAYLYAARHPEQVQALVVVDTGPETRRQGVQRITSFVAQDDVLDSFEAFVQRTRGYQPNRPEWQVRGSLKHNLKRIEDGRWTWKYDAVLRDPQYRLRRQQMLAPEAAWQAWGQIRCPTLIVRGAESDILDASVAQRMQQGRASCHLVEVPKAGHLVPGDNPAGFEQALMPFLAKLEGQGT
ncbi:MAG: alpha/beta hydrolase [Chloroflexi bacterium]|nr:alpha/beta hydrolase [Chloroflexota bacterium]